MKTSKIPYLFRYSGNKAKISRLLRPSPPHKRIVEGYLGSGAFSLFHESEAIGFDTNSDIIELWKFLQTTTVERLAEIEQIRAKAVAEHPKNKPDVRSLGLSKGEETYVRVNTSGVYVGQLSSWVLYPKWKLPINETSRLLEKCKQIKIIHGDVTKRYQEQDGDLLFLDPPYKNTHANYKQQAKIGIEEGYHPQQTIDLIDKVSCPIIFTYGTDAKTIFPQYDWQVVLVKKVPNIRRGGTVERTEHVAYINW